MPDLSSPNLTPDLNAVDASADTTSADTTSADAADFMNQFLARLNSESLKNQVQILEELSTSESGLAVLMRYLQERQSESADLPAGVIEGKIYQTLLQASPQTQAFVQTQFPQGIVPLISDRNIDYAPLQALLAQQAFEAADRLTIEKLCELAGEMAIQRKWLYFTEVTSFPTADLQTIDALWRVHSGGQFGFSVQRELWLGAAKNWEKLWHQIGWKTGNSWTRYPQAFTWTLEAPKGHLPLSNQLRGVRVISALLTHPAWDERRV